MLEQCGGRWIRRDLLALYLGRGRRLELVRQSNLDKTPNQSWATAHPESARLRVEDNRVGCDESVDGVAISPREVASLFVLSVAQPFDCTLRRNGTILLSDEGFRSCPPSEGGGRHSNPLVLFICVQRSFKMVGHRRKTRQLALKSGEVHRTLEGDRVALSVLENDQVAHEWRALFEKL
jgi:hypothetical protein